MTDDTGRPIFDRIGGRRQPIAVHQLDDQGGAFFQPNILCADTGLLHKALQVRNRFCPMRIDPIKDCLEFRMVGCHSFLVFDDQATPT